MLIDIKVNNLDKITNRLDKLSKQVKVNIDDTLKEFEQDITDRVNAEMFKRDDYPHSPVTDDVDYVPMRFPKKYNPPKLGIRSGKFKRAIKVKRTKLSLKVSLKKTSSAPYTFAQEFGAIITPKRSSKLTIPLNREAVGKRARSFKNTFIRNDIIFQKLGFKQFKPLYLLKRSVRLKERAVIRQSLRRLDLNKYRKLLLKNLK